MSWKLYFNWPLTADQLNKLVLCFSCSDFYQLAWAKEKLCWHHHRQLKMCVSFLFLSLSSVQRVWWRSLRPQHREVPSVSRTRPAHHPAARPVAQRRRWHGNAAGPHALGTAQRTATQNGHSEGKNTNWMDQNFHPFWGLIWMSSLFKWVAF